MDISRLDRRGSGEALLPQSTGLRRSICFALASLSLSLAACSDATSPAAPDAAAIDYAVEHAETLANETMAEMTDADSSGNVAPGRPAR